MRTVEMEKTGERISSAMGRDELGHEIYAFVEELYPICRSITGDGVRQTLDIIGKHIPLKISEVPTGTPAFDWKVPKEWNITDAFIKNSAGERVIDFKRCNLHVVNYSVPVKMRMSLAELKEHLFTLPETPDWIPYRTTYYREDWGFCLSHNQFLELEDDEYEVCIESSLEDGALTYGELLIEGQSAEEILISCHVCHPSLCNDNLSGVAVSVFLAQALLERKSYYSYRFLFIPGTIGSITWLSRNAEAIPRIEHGFVLTCVGDDGSFTYKRSRRGNAKVDRAFEHVLRMRGDGSSIIDFYPYGYDERQYCSPGFNLPIGCLMRSQHGQFPEYHTSADNLKFVKPEKLAQTFEACQAVLSVLEGDAIYINQNPRCEPQLGKRGLYKNVGGQSEGAGHQMAILWVLNLSDGTNSLLDIAERACLPFQTIKSAADTLLVARLLSEAGLSGIKTEFPG